jgi:transcriptional regulator with PAS, ATPase and Fis domain
MRDLVNEGFVNQSVTLRVLETRRQVNLLQQTREGRKLIQFRHQILEMQLAEVEENRIIARSPCILNALKQALKVSTVESTVLIQGESGSGKGVIADLIHKYSDRRRPMDRGAKPPADPRNG